MQRPDGGASIELEERLREFLGSRRGDNESHTMESEIMPGSSDAHP